MLALGLLSGPSALAASPFKRSLSEKKNAYLGDGVFTGGRASANGQVLVAVRRDFSAKARLERIVVELAEGENAESAAKGASVAATRAGQPGYFQVSIDSNRNRLVLDLAQLQMSKISEPQARALFKKSPYVRNVSLTLDPEDKAASWCLI
ncbi:MAG: hypothetical protein HC902_02330 [Calothrix sp. SM1_5_4]|nr:hypothetical protein [Calothrix sp. SM1_5_4]